MKILDRVVPVRKMLILIGGMAFLHCLIYLFDSSAKALLYNLAMDLSVLFFTLVCWIMLSEERPK